MYRGLKAAVIYFATVFAVGFVFGSIRVLFVVPRIGVLLAVMIELPLILRVSWVACGWCVRRYCVPATPASRLTMGGIAFMLTMAAEFGLSSFGFNRTIADHLEAYKHAPGILGLLAQIGFALFPLLQMGRSVDPSAASHKSVARESQ
jgi:hypothetical protein